ncbi:tRNA pseudouridine(38-40) synthase TruA [Sporosarcina pasteurii]|uniref:tRNA pseudouridine synthase A n=1 Tax=Sporosarcina pasteurii TaxID=1474 RepID=A0A380CJX8_SPOPA|nr:tRNA pseudouridine(38-40) synthase TruA [Sporosarcina pasteurii]MDS9472035.1 tRNA pseudouridine(38-40) synthase TruA [Sporosarcina pasteurii]QBQ06763.1 tRNA pseudouridine(38-40) synthase TruA [Sporosarcina pasteurii]SUJ20964.1 tRNA pseudouridine synthase A [Sporosarcina pasteurii]
MGRVKAVVAYDGTNFSGYQSQPGMRTVQSEIDKALVKIHKDKSVHSVASGRTDAGVHANGQVIHFDTPLTLKEERWQMALNVLLPTDIRIVNVCYVDENFHARYSATGKTYIFKWSYASVHSPFERNYSVHLGKWRPDVEKMKEAAKYLIGTYDFTSFCSAKTATSNRVRTVRLLTLERHDDELIMTIEGDGFLYNMVRTIAGMLLAVGKGWHQPEEVKEILALKDRQAASKTAPAHGLYLENVTYDHDNLSK